MTDDRLADIRARLAAATPGPWDIEPHAHPQAGCRCLTCDITTGYRLSHPTWTSCDETPEMQEANQHASAIGKRQEDCYETPMPWADAVFASHAADDIAWLLQREPTRDT